MDAIWYGIADIMEWIFSVVKPIGRMANILFVVIGFVATIYWLWYDKQATKLEKNFMSKSPGKD